ncbi:flagellar hook protein FlgE [Alkaliphilus sp. MSJ-5]|uniref:Flagellar hook protein FlgE n=1 Tax=Alkaliphilus flagellatus TaxID=2841507 RepID=A0ABS6G4K0_9FIRM|nr:flagellar hook protein FlgE [Alkaliphilus flagellatus]MBU5677420.1 flagellar hook protein FlgE [Alkaliphilus flagellatus]
MMRSMYSAVSSLRAHQLKMDVIGNNIANVNTVGYKGSRVTFQEVFSQTLRGAGRPQEGGRGGTNPQQVGLGVAVSSMDTFHIRGAVETTGYNTDLMINGEGFFIVSDTAGGANKSYTRAGNLGLDTDGNLITPDGYYVLGYESDGKGGFVESLTGLKISKSITNPPKATDKAIFEGNIDSKLKAPDNTDPANPILGEKFSTVMKIYDSLGNPHNIEVTFERTDDGNGATREFDVNITKIDDVEQTDNLIDLKLEFNSEGKLISTTKSIDLEVQDPANSGVFQGANPLNINLDFSALTSYAEKSDAAALNINGYGSGKLDDFTIADNGEIEGVFSNGQIQILGKIRLANFKNPAGLIKTGSNMYRETSNSGEAMFGDAGMGGFGSLRAGALEMSNVDLSNEFTNMITTQRGFQANSRIITTSDEMLQEVVNIKR